MRRALALVFVTLIALFFALQAFTRTAWFQAEVRSRVRPLVFEHLNMTVDWSSLDIDPLALRVELVNFVAYSGSNTDVTPFLQSPLVTARLSWPSLLNRTIDIDPIIAHKPILRFGHDENSWVNFLDIDAIDRLAESAGGGAEGGWSVVIRRVRLDSADADFFLTPIDLRAHLTGLTAEGRFDSIAEYDRIPIRAFQGSGLYRMFGRDFQIDDLKATLAVEIIDGPWADLVIDEATIRGSYPNATVQASGRIIDVARRHLFRMRGTGETELNFLNDIFFDEPRFTGTAAFDVRYDGDFENFKVGGEIAGDSILVDQVLVTNVKAKAEVTENDLKITSSAFKVFGGDATFEGNLLFADLSWYAKTGLQNFNPHELRGVLRGLPETRGKLTATYEGSGFLSPEFSTEGRASLATPALTVGVNGEALSIQEGTLEAAVSWTGDQVVLGRGQLQTSREQILFSGNLQKSGAVELDLSVQSGDLSILSVITGFPIDGWGTAEGAWHGTLTEPELEFNFSARDVKLPWFESASAGGILGVTRDQVYFSDITAEIGGGTAWLSRGTISNLQSEPYLDLEVQADSAQLASVLDPLLAGALPINGLFTGSFVLHSPATAPTGYAEGKVVAGEVWGEQVQAAVGRVNLQGGTVTFENLQGEADGGRLSASARIVPDSDLWVRVDGRGLDVSKFALLEGYGLTGTADATMTVRSIGQGDAEIDLTADAPNISAFGVALGGSQVTLRKRGEQLKLDATTTVGRGSAQILLTPDYPATITIFAAAADLTPLLGDFGEDASLSVSGRLSYDGPLASLQTGKGEAVLSKIQFKHERVAIQNEGPAYLALAGGQVAVKRLALAGENTAGVVSGTVGLDGELDLRVLGGLELQFFTLFIDGLKSADGRVEIDGSVAGTVASPDVTASLRVRNGRLQLADTNLLFENVDATGEFNDGQIIIDTLRSRLGSGGMSGTGVINMDGLVPTTLSMTASLNEAEARIPDWLFVRVNGRLELSGPIDDVLMRGDLDIVQAVYNERVDWESLLLRFRPAARDPLLALGKKKGFHVDLGLHSAGSVFVKNNLADLKLRGDLQLIGYPPDVGISGNMQVVNGSIIFRENIFTIESGQINFVDPGKIRPVLDLRARTRVEESTASGTRRFDDITVDASGPPDNLQIDLTSSPPLNREDIISLLYIRRRTSEDIGGGLTATNEAVSLALKLNDDLAGFQSEVQEYFGFENLVLEPAFTDTSRSGTLKLRAEKMLSRNLKATLATSLSSADLDFWLGYGFTDNMLLDFGWNSLPEQDIRGTSTDNNVGNFKIRPRLHFEFQ